MEDSHNWGRLNRWKHWEYRYCGGISPYPQVEKPEQRRFGFFIYNSCSRTEAFTHWCCCTLQPEKMPISSMQSR